MLIRGKVKYRFQGHREVSQQSLLKHSLLLTSDSGEKERDDMRKSPRLNENATPSARPGNSLSHMSYCRQLHQEISSFVQYLLILNKILLEGEGSWELGMDTHTVDAKSGRENE